VLKDDDAVGNIEGRHNLVVGGIDESAIWIGGAKRVLNSARH
jgi:hypothetical protein